MKEQQNNENREISGEAKKISELLHRKYTLDYYQRGYRWQTNQVTDLIDDLTNKFSDNYQSGDARSQVENYTHYFLGSIIISRTRGKRFIVDGQQRLTTLTLLLIKLRQMLEDENQRGQLATLIFSEIYGQRSFNLDIDERESIMNALYSEESLDRFVSIDQSESIRNIAARYNDIENHFELEIEQLPYFVDWLLQNVYMVQITAYDDGDAYTIFETMNDRGLSLTPAEMLKGYLLSKFDDTIQRNSANNAWKNRVQILKDIGKDEDANAIKAWLRSKYAEEIRERTKGASPRDFELIGTQFHRWVRTNEERLGLNSDNGLGHFVEKDFVFYTCNYEKLVRASKELITGLECVYYNAQNGFALQYPVLLSPLLITDSDEQISKKLKIVSRFLDILIHRRIWNFRAISHSTMFYAMFLLMREIRGKSSAELIEILQMRLTEDSESFSNENRFRMHGTNRKKVHQILARITDFIEIKSENANASNYASYCQQGTSGYEIEHIWADHPERHQNDFNHEHDFQEYRNFIGGLLLLPKLVNASINDKPYCDKLMTYAGQNLLAKSLHESAYEHNPGFRQFRESSELPFHAYSEFNKEELDMRQKLYQLLAEQIWNPDRLLEDNSAS